MYWVLCKEDKVCWLVINKGYQEEDFRVVIWRNKSDNDPDVIQTDPDLIQTDPNNDPNNDPNVIQIVGLIQNNPKISRAELAERLQISERKTRICIEQLKKEGILIRE